MFRKETGQDKSLLMRDEVVVPSALFQSKAFIKDRFFFLLKNIF